MHLLLRPRPRLITALQPYLKALRSADSLVALHIRSGWVDDMLSVPDALELSSAHAAAELTRALALAPAEVCGGALIASSCRDLARSRPHLPPGGGTLLPRAAPVGARRTAPLRRPLPLHPLQERRLRPGQPPHPDPPPIPTPEPGPSPAPEPCACAGICA